jgi:predicted MFS family arabinose efflux permease
VVGGTLAPSRAWATLPISTFVIGTMCATIPVAFFMRRIGRKRGFIGGSLVGGAICIGSFTLFTNSTLLLGVCQTSSRTSERNKDQALNDFAIFATVALTALTSGALLEALGRYAVNYAVFPMVAIGLVLILWFAAGAQRSEDAIT